MNKVHHMGNVLNKEVRSIYLFRWRM